MKFRTFIIAIVLASAFFGYKIIGQMRAAQMLADVPAGNSLGPEKADLTIVEFLNYTSTNCRTVDPILREALKKDEHVRYIPRPVYSNDGTSEKYVQLAYAAGEQGKFMQMHDALITDFRALDSKRIAQLAASLGLDHDKLNKDMAGQNVVERKKENIRLSQAYGARSFPHFVIDGIAWAPASRPTMEDFLSLFREARFR